MRCPICAWDGPDPIPARHLPRFFRCPKCTGYFHREGGAPPYPEVYFSDKDSGSVSFGGRILSVFLLFRERIIKNLLTKPSSRILDYGCGNGKLVSYLHSRGFRIDGYDPSAAAVSLATKTNIPVYGFIPDRQYDLIMFWHSLEHSDTPLEDVIACKRRCAPHSKLLIAVPNGLSWEARLTGEAWFCYDWPFHRVHFTPRALEILLEKAGFRVRSVDHANPEYALSSLAQTFLNLFLPKNVFYSLVADRRGDQGRAKRMAWGLISLAALAVFFPFLLVIYAFECMTKKTAAFIVVAEKNP